MIRDRFVIGHRDCDLRQHLHSVPPETPIRDIVDICRVWESHAYADEFCETGTGEDPVDMHGERTGGHTSGPGSCGRYYSSGGVSRPQDFADTVASECTGTGASPGTHGDRDYAGTPALDCTSTGAGVAASARNHGCGNNAAASAAAGDADTTVASGPSS